MSDGILTFPSTLNTTAIVLALVASLCCLVPLFFRKTVVDKDGNPTPPGPLLRYPFLRKFPELVLDGWAKQFGPLFSLWMGNQLYIVISDQHIARDIFVNNGAIFSSRKNYFIKNQSILRGRAITASQYNDKWRHHRRIAAQFLTPKAVTKYANEIDYEAHILMQTFYTSTAKGAGPVSPQHDTVRYALNVMLIMALGIRTDDSTHPFVDRTLELTLEFNDLTGPLSNVEDFITPLQWIPTTMQKRGRKLHDAFVEVYGGFLLEVKAKLNKGEDVPDCLAKTLILTQEQEGLDWEDMCMLIAVFVLGGVHSTAGIIQWFLALLPAHPEIQRRAHEELDSVIGQDTWPTAEDESRLPYTRAIIKEVLRVHAPFWMATPHYSTEDYVYKGYFIPKNTGVILNCFTLHHDENRYPNAHAFNPDRYIDDHLSCADSAKLSNVMERDHWTFGAGRRICPGMAVAERELWLAISRILWSFTVHEMPNEPISLEEYEGQSGRTPKPFRVRMIPRHDRVHSLLQSRDEITF
ncbi:cytochrome P450 [Cristinia sonorae]|uniref:Cytochrome P450 n=1 Tax=Cristinia sonorae TaxID=1940300 RepID=A0A8K0UWQ6_9AGAR|nr:cytochrome P450 [Cristinia sonorae]